MKKTKYLTTGEFAKLCRTTKETLFHYDKENLLKPKHIAENGYRCYGVEQFFDFDLIAILKDTGSSLREIRHIIHDVDTLELLALFEEKKRLVREERAKLAQREVMLQDFITLTRDALNQDFDMVTIVEQERERLEVLPTRTVSLDSTEEIIERFSDHIDFYYKQNRIIRPPFGVIIALDDVQTNPYAECRLFSRATRATPRSMLHIKPEGRYAVLAHKGKVPTHLRACRELLKTLEDAGFQVADNL